MAISLDQTLLYLSDYLTGLYLVDITKAFQDLFVNINPDVDLKQKRLGAIKPYSLGMAITNDGKYLYQGVMGEGVHFYQLAETPLTPKFVQNINDNSKPYEISLNQDYSLVAVNGVSDLTIYEINPPNLNRDFPNFFNYKSSIFQTFDDIPPVGYEEAIPTQIELSIDQILLAIAYHDIGTYILDMTDMDNIEVV